MSSHDPPGRSTRPTEPAKSTSPASSPGASPRSREKTTDPRVCPGACRTVSSTPASDSTAPSSSGFTSRSEEHTSELQSRQYLVCRLLLEKKKAPWTDTTKDDKTDGYK